jgi:hypothetical protein
MDDSLNYRLDTVSNRGSTIFHSQIVTTVIILGTRGVLCPAIFEAIWNEAREDAGTVFKECLCQQGVILVASRNSLGRKERGIAFHKKVLPNF